MAKAKAVFSGSDSVGRDIQVAQRVDGIWFWRSYGWNGYNNAWCKWTTLAEDPTHPTRMLNRCEYANSPEYNDIDLEQQCNYINWGFSILCKSPATEFSYRLPN